MDVPRHPVASAHLKHGQVCENDRGTPPRRPPRRDGTRTPGDRLSGANHDRILVALGELASAVATWRPRWRRSHWKDCDTKDWVTSPNNGVNGYNVSSRTHGGALAR